MSQIVTTKVGRFRHVTPDAWLWECPCGQWSYLTTDQWAGRVSVDHASQGCPVKYHETHNYEAELVVTMQARILTGEPPIDPESPVEPTPPTNQALREANDALVAIRARLWEVLDGRDIGGDRSLLAMVNRVIDQRDEARENRRGEFDLRMAAERRVVGASEPPSEPPSAGNQTYTVQMSDAEAAPAPCVWRENEDGLWDTSCGREWEFIDDGPKENRVKFCIECGQPVQSVPLTVER